MEQTDERKRKNLLTALEKLNMVPDDDQELLDDDHELPDDDQELMNDDYAEEELRLS
jgi:hypothetical protein